MLVRRGRCAIHPGPLLTLAILISFLAAGPVGAQTQQTAVRVGVLLPAVEPAQTDDWDSLLAIRAWEREREWAGSGIPIDLIYGSSSSDAGDIREEVRRLVNDEQVHALICCTSPNTALAVTEMDLLLPMLLLARPTGTTPTTGMTLSLRPSPLAVARALALDARRYAGGVSLLTVESAQGEVAEASLRNGLIEAGVPLVEIARYQPGSGPLTPEALIVAASQPGAVVVWGHQEDTVAALTALDERGYDGPVYLPPNAEQGVPGGLRNFRLAGVHIPVAPVALGKALPEDHPNAPAVDRFSNLLTNAYGGYTPTVEGALAFDSLELLRIASDLAFVYGVVPADIAAFRQALGDALIGMGVVAGAAGSYDLTEPGGETALARGVLVATVRAGGLHLE